MRIMTRFTGSFLLALLLAGCSSSLDLLQGNRLTDITIKPRNLTLAIGEEQDYTAEGVMHDGTFRDISKKVIWASSDTTVASFFRLEGRTILLTVGPGTAVLTATLGSLQSEGSLVVVSSALKSLQLNTIASTIEVGKNQRVRVTGTLSNGQTKDLTNGVLWSSSDPSVATISNVGLVTALTPGMVTITAVTGEMMSTAKLTIPTPTLEALKITPSTNSVVAGRTQQFVAEGSFSNGTTKILTSDAAWNSSEPAVAAIDANGLATAVAKGLKQPRVVLVTAVYEKISKSVELTVTPPELTQVEVTPAGATVAMGRTALFAANGIFTDGTTILLTSDVAWRSSEPSLVTIDKQGLAKVISAGKVVITAVFKKQTGTANLTATLPELTEIRVSPAIPFIAAGRTQQFSAEGSFSDGTIQVLKEGLNWTSANDTIATISQEGKATAVAKGVTSPLPVRMTATSGKINGIAKLTVMPPELAEIRVIPVIPFVVAGKTQQFAAQGILTDGTDQPLTGVKWSSSEPTAVTIDRETGLAVTKNPKRVTITAVLEKLTGAAKLTVTEPELSTIRISPNKDVAGGLTVSFTAEGTFTDDAVLPLSNAKWRSSDPSVLLFKEGSNTATALSPGTVTLTASSAASSAASSGTIIGTTTLTVTPPALTAIHISPLLPIIAGQTVSFLAKGTFTDGAVLPLTSNVTWHSSDPAIILFTENSSTATALLKGEVKLTATSGTIVKTALLTILAPELTAIRIMPLEAIVAAGQTQAFTAEGSFTNGTTQVLTSDISFSSSNISVVSIEKNSGAATTLIAGEATITAVSKKMSAVAKMTVTPPALNEIRVTPDKKIITAGQTQKFSAEGIYTDKTTRPLTDEVAWSASDTSVVTVNKEGIATATTKGVDENPQAVNITAVSGKISGMAKLTVIPPELTAISVVPMTPSIVAGYTQLFTAIGAFTDGTKRPLTDSVKWSSSEPSIVTINADGLAETILKGMEHAQGVTITATSSKIQGSAKLTVTPAELTQIRLLLNEASVAAGKTTKFVVEGSFTDGTTRKLTTDVAVSSSDKTVAEIVMAGGFVKTRRPGNITLTAIAGKVTGAINLTVTEEALTEIRVQTATTSMAAGRTALFTVEGSFTNGTTKPLRSGLTFTSSHPLLLTLDKDGLGTAISAGDVVITAASGNIAGTAKLTITPAELTSIRISPDKASAIAGRTQQFSLEGSFSDGTTLPLTTGVVWSSSNPSVAKIETNGGLATALAQGLITITAVSEKINNIAHLTVTPPELTGIHITPENPSRRSGETQQFTAMGFFTDNIERPLKTDVTWESKDSSVATINEDGLITTAGRGVDIPLTTRIVVVHGKFTSTTNLTVMPN